MRVLVACECSGVVREAFRSRGHDTWSCDLKPAEDGSPYHIQADALYWSHRREWDLMIAHPPCTRLSNSGVLRLYRNGKKAAGRDALKWQEMVEGAHFFRNFLWSRVPLVAIENPIMHGYAAEIVGQKYAQIIQPHQFGDDASKATCLWLKGLPVLLPTRRIAGRVVNGRERWANQTDSGQNKLPPSKHRAADRARTYQGIADAMADQWGTL